ncbi:uncharacterized protein LOC115954327 [Quercus lobata]|uniref:uncharacterized protein LOC115954327 n=1 Tax=Quercus lobata TaxID=97700 RepID=UPI001248D69E|nr:uncharacterized protein LOC115954327 [Quercus lobata]
MSSPEADEVLFAYIAVAPHAVSLVLVRDDNGVQRPVYYVTREILRWKVYVDGTANQKGSGIGLVLISPEGIAIEKSLRFGFLATNNEAEYEALLQGMMMVQKLGRKAMEAFSDSRLVVGQVMGELEARDARMQEYLIRVKRLQSDFESFNLTHIPRTGNTHADSLATFATSSAHDLP